jgi:hypothetical protein
MKSLVFAGAASIALAASGSALALSTDYNVTSPSAPGYSQYPETQIEITTNTILVRPDGAWGSVQAPTPGAAFLVVNGATSYNPGGSLRDFVKENLDLTAGTPETFTFDVANLYAVSPPTLVVTVDGVVTGASSYTPSDLGVWHQETFTFTPTTSGWASVGFADSNLQASGNDFAVSGIPGVPEPTTWAMLILGLGAVGVALRRRPVAVTA